MKPVIPAEVWLVKVVDLLQSCHSKHMSKVQIDTEWSKSYFIWISTENDLAVAVTASKVCTVLVQQIQWMRWNSNVQFPHNRVTKKWKALLNWNGRDIMSRHAVIPFAPSWAYFTYYSLPDVIFSFLFKVRRIEHLRTVMHRKIKTHTAAQTAVDSISNAAAVCVCAQLFIWRKVFHVITSADGTESECTAFGRLITAGDKCLCLSAVCVPDAAVYAVGTAVFHSHSPLSSPTATHSSVPNTPARSVEVNTHTHYTCSFSSFCTFKWNNFWYRMYIIFMDMWFCFLSLLCRNVHQLGQTLWWLIWSVLSFGLVMLTCLCVCVCVCVCVRAAADVPWTEFSERGASVVSGADHTVSERKHSAALSGVPTALPEIHTQAAARYNTHTRTHTHTSSEWGHTVH